MPRKTMMMIPLLFLAACSDGSQRWAKPGVSSRAASADFAVCESEAHAATQRDAAIDADIMATRGNDWERTSTLATRREDMANSTRSYSERIIASCMAAMGYRPAR